MAASALPAPKTTHLRRQKIDPSVKPPRQPHPAPIIIPPSAPPDRHAPWTTAPLPHHPDHTMTFNNRPGLHLAMERRSQLPREKTLLASAKTNPHSQKARNPDPFPPPLRQALLAVEQTERATRAHPPPKWQTPPETPPPRPTSPARTAGRSLEPGQTQTISAASRNPADDRRASEIENTRLAVNYAFRIANASRSLVLRSGRPRAAHAVPDGHAFRVRQ
jgi:hypothetical protein